MKRWVWSIFAFALVITAPTAAARSPSRSPVVLDANGNVSSFYGIPITLTRAGLKRLPYRVRKEYYYAEGDRYTKYRITAKDKVDVFVTFERNGKFESAWTESLNAVGLKGMRIGSTLADLKVAWPDGDFSFYWEDGYVVTFRTPANVSFMFDRKDMPPGAFDHDRPRDFPVPGDITVKTIAVFPKPRPPLKKEWEPVDPNKHLTTVETTDGKVISTLEVRRPPESSMIHLTWTHHGKVEQDRAIDVSNYPDLDEWSGRLLNNPDPVVVSFRYGNFKNCRVREDDRDKVYVTLDSTGATLSASPPKGAVPLEGWPSPKYVGNLMNSAAHGCRRTYDPHTGAFGLEKAD